MSQSLLFFDIDGTIIDEMGRIPDSTVEALRAVRQNGGLCFVNTGRPFGHIDRRVLALGFDGYICSCGQHIEYFGKTILHAGFDAAESYDIAQTVRRCGLNALYESERGVWLDFHDPIPPVIRRDRDRFASYGLKTAGAVTDPDFQFDKFCVWESAGSNLVPLREKLRDRCTMIDRGRENFYECILKEYSKATGIAAIRALTGVPPNRCYAFGDGPNDLPMLTAVPHSVAMGNAPNEVKAVCEYVTAPLHQGGIAEAIRHYGLIQTEIPLLSNPGGLQHGTKI